MISVPNGGGGGIAHTASSNSASSSGSASSSNSTKFSYIKTASSKFSKFTSGGGNANSATGTSTVKATTKKSPHTAKTTTSANSNSVFTSSISAGTMMPSVKSRLKKNFSRTKEKILQGIGKTDRTNDQHFDLYVDNFDKQNSQASKLTKELNKYLSCLKETQKSSRAFYETLKETYEDTWPDSDIFTEQIELTENKWHDYINSLSDDVQHPLIAYLNEFPELKKKIEKRGNRLLDYDDARHTLENLQNKTSKKALLQNGEGANANGGGGSSSSTSTTSSTATTDQLTKLTKLKIDLEDKQNIYEEINQTLCMTLPVLYENRIKFYSSLFQTFFHTETTFHSDCAEVKSKLDDICENLSTKTVQQQYVPETSTGRNENTAEAGEEVNSLEKENGHVGENDVEAPNSEFIPSDDLPQTKLNTSGHHHHHNLNNSSSDEEDRPCKLSELEIKNPDSSLDNLKPVNVDETTTPEDLVNSIVNTNGVHLKCLYTVKATYAYEAKEVDELTFVKDDIIEVVEGTPSEKEELDEGWLIGIHKVTSKRGLFPENFTKKI